MGLKQLRLEQYIKEGRAKLDGMKTRAAEFAQRRKALEEREKVLEDAVKETTEETSAEDRALLDQQVAEWEAQDKALNEEETANAEEVRSIEAQIAEWTADLDRIAMKVQRSVEKAQRGAEKNEEGEKPMDKRTRKFFGHMTEQERSAFLAHRDERGNEDVKACIQRFRDTIKEKRAISGGELAIPDVMLEMVRDNIGEFSKLYKHVNAQRVSGTARQNVLGEIPEGVWTDMCAKINELTLGLSQVEVDGYKVAGYIPVCNAVLMDNDIGLAAAIVEAITAGLGYALDKAIVFGQGAAGKMPQGIYTRLAETQRPSGYSAKAPQWVDLHTTNIITVPSTATGIKLFQALAKARGKAKSKKAKTGRKFWAMNDATWATTQAEAMSINAVGAIVTGATDSMEMPGLGGKVEILDFMPDDMIVGGYGELYLLAEREGMTVDMSSEVLFLDDQTVFRSKARYDGKPVIAEAFIAIGLNGTAPSATGVNFPSDVANDG